MVQTAPVIPKNSDWLGPKQLSEIAAFMPGLMFWGTAAFITLIFFTEWKVITKRIPFYNRKYPVVVEEVETPPPAQSEESIEVVTTGDGEGGEEVQTKKEC